MLVAIAILTTLAAGVPVTLAIDRAARGPALVGLSLLYGTALVWAVESGLSVAGVPWTLGSVNAGILLVSAICLFLARRPTASAPVPRNEPVRPHPVDLLTVVVVACYGIFATIAPVWEWDFWAIWGLKARVFLGSGGIDWRYLQNPWNEFVHPDYPLLLPLNYGYAALFSGGWNDRWLGLYTVAFGVALLLVIRQLVTAEAGNLAGAVTAFAATAFALSGSIGMAEAPVIAFGTAALLYLRRALQSDDAIDARHGALLLGCAAMTKLEGFSLMIAVALAAALTSRKLLLRLWPAAVLYAPWAIVKATHTLPNDLVQGSAAKRLFERLWHPAALVQLLAAQLSDGRVWVLVVLALGVIPARWLWRERFTGIALAIQLAAFTAAYLVTPHDMEWQVATSWPRLSRQLAAPLVCIVMILLARTAAGEDDQPHAEARPDL